MKRTGISFFSIFIISVFLVGCNNNSAQNTTNAEQNLSEKRVEVTKTDEINNKQMEAKITFIELGSVNCIPCRMMQPVMKNIEKKYGEQIEVVFYDVWQPEQKHYAREYGIRVIPTQIFLNSDGEEILRHEGFFPEEEIDKFLHAEGLVVTEK